MLPHTIWFLALAIGLAVGCTRDDGSTGVADAGNDADASINFICQPDRCEDDPAVCGLVDDGCQGLMDCGPCLICASTADCPSRPCLELQGCEDAECVYAPSTCDDRECVCPEDSSCDEESLRRCGFDECSARMCDPSPVADENGALTYGNVCVPPLPLYDPCGTCDLGRTECGGGSSRVCSDIVMPALDLNFAQCSAVRDGVVGLSPTFVFVDPLSDVGAAFEDGTRERPFTDYLSAVSSARSRNAAVLVIAGSEILNPVDDQGELVPLRIYEGVSLLGGYASDFRPDPAQRPRILGATQLAPVDEPSFVAAIAVDIDVPTAIEHLEIASGDIPDEAGDDPTYADTSVPNNYGLWAKASSGLHLVDVKISVGDVRPPDGWSAAVYCDESEVAIDQPTKDLIIASVPAGNGPPGNITGHAVDCEEGP